MPSAAATLQRRVLLVLFMTQVIGGVGVAIGVSVGALLAAEMAGIAVSGLAQSAAVVGTAVLAVPATLVSRRFGRRLSLAATYLVASFGGAVVVLAAVNQLVPLLFVGLFLFGGGTAAGLQSRYTAVDLAPPELRGRHLSLIVWATTIGAVAGPNLAPVAGAAVADYGVPTLAGPFLFSALLFTGAASLLLVLLRPDPLLTSRTLGAAGGTRAHPPGAEFGMRTAVVGILSRSRARLGLAAMAAGHLVMIGVMSMTPVRIMGAGHGPEATLEIVGIVLSLHIAGMFACAPLTGWLSDRFGRPAVILGGAVLLLTACAIAGTAGHDSTRLTIGLTLLGLGWSGTMVAGSTLLSESVSADLRASAQGASDFIMGLAGAGSGALSGFVLEATSYPILTVIAASVTLPLAVLALRTRDAGSRYP
jgi:MFS family permease